MSRYEHPLVVRSLKAGYGERVVLKDVSMHVRKGTVHVILGGSGSGKTTFLKHAIGLAKPLAGEVHLLGVDVAAASETEYEAVMTHVGMLFQGGALLNSMTLRENVALPLVEKTKLPASVIDDIVRMKLELVSLTHAIDRTPPELSGGMKKRAALARAMALDPEVLFCDEPSAGLDPITAAELDELLLSLRDRFGMTIIVVTHELASIDTIADDVTMLARGEVLLSGPLARVKSAELAEVRAFFDRVPSAGAAASGASVLAAMGARP